MSIDHILLLVGVAVLAICAMAVGLAAAWYAGRQQAGALDAPPPGNMRPNNGPTISGARTAASEAALETPRPGLYDRMVRVVAFVFLAAAAFVVAISGAWSDTAEAIYLLLAAGTLFIVFVQDLLPAGLLGRARCWVEGVFAVAFLAVLMGLTDGLKSPFFVGFFLLVAGATLSGEGLAPVVLALVAAAAYGAVGLIMAAGNPLGAATLAWIAFNVASLGLLAFIATVAGREQRRAREAAIQLSRFDPLTGLYNRGYFFSVMDREVRRSGRMGHRFTMLMLDIDDLKPVNDTFGHQYGDRLLRAITEVIRRTVRATDTAARYGGDEFVVLLPETDPDGAFVVSEKLRRDISALAIRADDRSVRTSVSVGLVSYPDDGETIEQLVSAVDAAMYEAKRRGKNQIVGYTTRTERVATSIAVDGGVFARPLGQRPDESRANEVQRARDARPQARPPEGTAGSVTGPSFHAGEAPVDAPRGTRSPPPWQTGSEPTYGRAYVALSVERPERWRSDEPSSPGGRRADEDAETTPTEREGPPR